MAGVFFSMEYFSILYETIDKRTITNEQYETKLVTNLLKIRTLYGSIQEGEKEVGKKTMTLNMIGSLLSLARNLVGIVHLLIHMVFQTVHVLV